MKRLQHSIWNLILLFILSACATLPAANQPTAEQSPVGKEWQLFAYGFTDNLLQVTPGHIPTLFLEDGEVRGSGGCNSYGGGYTLEGDKLSFGPLMQTEMACMDDSVMEQESAFFQIMGGVEEFTLQADLLTLRGSQGVLQFKLPEEKALIPLEGTLWQLQHFVTFEGETAAADAALSPFPITIWFENGQATGSTGCNSYGTAYTLDTKDGIKFGPEMMMTATMCVDETANQQEARFTAVLKDVHGYQVQDETLTLTFPGGELVFQRQPDPGSDANAVWEAVLADWGEGPFVIRSETAFNGRGISLESTLEKVKEQVETTSATDLFALQEETLADYESKNATPMTLGSDFHTRFQTTVLTDEQIRDQFEKDGQLDWETFKSAYPDAGGIYTLSQVGMNAEGTQALVYLGLESEQITAGWYSLMVKNQGIWGATTSFIVWEK